MHKHLRRLDRIWPDSPIYFITMCTKNRWSVLARDEASEILIREWNAAQKSEKEWRISKRRQESADVADDEYKKYR